MSSKEGGELKQGDQAREKTLDAARVTKEESLVEGRVQI
jgi:hypothetical protein